MAALGSQALEPARPFSASSMLSGLISALEVFLEPVQQRICCRVIRALRFNLFEARSGRLMSA